MLIEKYSWSFQFSQVYYAMFILFICSLSDNDYEIMMEFYLWMKIEGLIHFLLWMFYWFDPWPGLTLGSLRPLGWVTS